MNPFITAKFARQLSSLVSPEGAAIQTGGSLIGFFLHFLVKCTKKGAISALSY